MTKDPLHYVFDVDGALSKMSKAIQPLMQALVESGHRVTVLVGGVAGTDSAKPEWAAELVRSLGLVPGDYSNIVLSMADNLKGAVKAKEGFCKKNNVIMVM